MVNKIKSGINFMFLGRLLWEKKLSDFERTGNRLVHVLAFSWAVLLHEIYEPKLIVTGMSGKNMGNDSMTVITYLFLTITLLLISDIRSKDRKMNSVNALKYYVRSIILILFYCNVLYWLFVMLNLINYGVFHLSPFDAVRLPPS